MTARLIRVLALALAGICVTIVLIVAPGPFSARPQATSADSAATLLPAPAISPTRHHASVVTIGDSIMAGHGVETGEDWVALVAAERGWTATNLADDGSGFLSIGNNGDTFADQARAAVALNPELLIIGGSSNDFGFDEAPLETATLSTISYLHDALPDTEIISLSTVWGNDYYPDQLSQIDGEVHRATTLAAGIYLDLGQPLVGGDGLMQPDEIHPTARGQQMLATAIGDALTRAEIVY
jgi:acyl-CoA thioesterase-1